MKYLAWKIHTVLSQHSCILGQFWQLSKVSCLYNPSRNYETPNFVSGALESSQHYLEVHDMIVR